MISVAITGNIASGKSTVQKIIEQEGYHVLDTDICGHNILKKSVEVKELFKNYDVFDDSGEIDRTKLGQIVFRNTDLKTQLENIVHPLIKEEIKKFLHTNKNEQYCFVGIPLLFEANMQNLFDKILLIYTPDEIRVQRLIERNNYTIDYAKTRIDSQMSQDKKIMLSDFIIENTSDKANLTNLVKDFLYNKLPASIK